MPVIISNPQVIPEVVQDKLHVDSFILRHKRENNPARQIDAVGVAYGEDSNGNKQFSSDTRSVKSQDFESVIVAASGKTPEQFMTDYASAKAAINTDYQNGNISYEDLMAYFELAVGVVFNLLDDTQEVSGIE